MLLTKNNVIQLDEWAENNTDVTNQEVIDSKLYIDMKNATSCFADKANLTSEGLVLLAKIAAKSTSLEGLYVAGEYIGDKSEAFANALVDSTSLTKLSCTIIDNVGAFATAIAKCPHLTFLCVGKNQLSDDDAHILVKELSYAPSLERIAGYEDLYDQAILQKAGLEITNYALRDYLPSELINNIVEPYASFNKEEMYTVSEAVSALNPFLEDTEIDIIVGYLGDAPEPESPTE